MEVKLRKSQYTDSYLADAAARLKAGKHPLTPGKFLGYRLRGEASVWKDRNIRSLESSLRRVGAVETRSACGRKAYRLPEGVTLPITAPIVGATGETG
jgi:hypothetical protein